MLYNVGAVAQLREHLLCKQGVAGSIPVRSTCYKSLQATTYIVGRVTGKVALLLIKCASLCAGAAMRRIDRITRRHAPQRTAAPAPVRPIVDQLEALHQEIDSCEVCAPIVGEGFFKPRQLVRGGLSKVVIVGQGPGKAEVRHSRAFAGMSGRRLDSWLMRCGASVDSPRERVYLTSVAVYPIS